MRAAASNTAGAMTGFMGMGMAGQAGGASMQELYAMGKQQNAASAQQAGSSVQPSGGAAGGWQCACGAVNTGNFCSQCGAKKPEEKWTCSCGAVNTGNFCPQCGAKKPDPKWTCSCGTVNEGKFCSNCGTKRPE
jgi:membrane protease subunit (stomatin/prohibitin family)